MALFPAAAGVCSAAARAQPGVKRLGVLIEFPEGDLEANARLAALQAGLRALGWTEGVNLRSEVRFGSASAVTSTTLLWNSRGQHLTLFSGAELPLLQLCSRPRVRCRLSLSRFPIPWVPDWFPV